MKWSFRVTGDVEQRLRSGIPEVVRQARQGLVQSATHQLLRSIIEETPVETGQARGAWVQGLEQLGGQPPSGWEGTSSSGVQEGDPQGSGQQFEDDTFSRMSVENQVEYVRFLEYGTSRMAPVAMVRRGLQFIRGQLGNYFRLRRGQSPS